MKRKLLLVLLNQESSLKQVNMTIAETSYQNLQRRKFKAWTTSWHLQATITTMNSLHQIHQMWNYQSREWEICKVATQLNQLMMMNSSQWEQDTGHQRSSQDLRTYMVVMAWSLLLLIKTMTVHMAWSMLNLIINLLSHLLI